MTTVSPYLTQIKLNQLTDRHAYLPVPPRTYDSTDGWISTPTGDQRSWDVTDTFYEADDARDAATEAMAAAETARAAAITTVSELKESITRIASLTGLDPSEVRKLKRTTPSPDTDADLAASAS